MSQGRRTCRQVPSVRVAIVTDPAGQGTAADTIASMRMAMVLNALGPPSLALPVGATAACLGRSS